MAKLWHPYNKKAPMKRKAIFFNKAFSAFSRWLFDPHSTDDQRIESVNKRVKEIKQSN